LPFLERLHRGKAALQVIAISQDDARASAEFNRIYDITFATLLDPREEGYRVSNAYQITNVPSLFLVEQDGLISQSVAGFEKAQLETLGQRFGVAIFDAGERVPVFRPG
jgi:peroxiredoxin